MSSIGDLYGSKTKSVNFPKDPPYTAEGVILAAEQLQGTDWDTKQPETWDDGEPKLTWVVTLQTDERDPEVADDDGKRNLWCRSHAHTALREAISETFSSARDVDSRLIGSAFKIQFYATEQVKLGRRKLYRVKITPGAAAAALYEEHGPPAPPVDDDIW